MAAIGEHYCDPRDAGHSRFFVAEADGKVVGCALVLRGSSMAIEKGHGDPANADGSGPGNRHIAADDPHSSVFKVSVRSDARRLGVGVRLMEQCETVARDEWGCRDMDLVTANQRAIRFYESIGFDVHQVMHAIFHFRAVHMLKVWK